KKILDGGSKEEAKMDNIQRKDREQSKSKLQMSKAPENSRETDNKKDSVIFADDDQAKQSPSFSKVSISEQATTTKRKKRLAVLDSSEEEGEISVKET